jgi:serine protease AprX
VPPALVKGLVIHSATLNAMPIDDEHRPYYGAGVPGDLESILYDAPHRFTTIHEVELRTGVNWERRPLPIPQCLLTSNGKIQGAATLTVCFDPHIDAAHGDESVRTSIEASFGRYVLSNGKEKFEGAIGQSRNWESELVDRGKWGPVTSGRKVWKQGIKAGGDWALKLRLTARSQTDEPLIQRAFVILTLEALQDNQPVRADGLSALQKLSYPYHLAAPAQTITLTPKP